MRVHHEEHEDHGGRGNGMESIFRKLQEEGATLGARLKLIRGSKTQKQFAAELGITTNTWAMYERDERIPGADLLQSLCLQSEADPAWLLMGKQPGTSADSSGAALAPPTDEIVTLLWRILSELVTISKTSQWIQGHIAALNALLPTH